MQAQVLQLQRHGEVTDAEVLEYEIRQEVVQEICAQLDDTPKA
jgi:hypothetical protein